MWLALFFNKWTWILFIVGGLCLTIGVQRVALRHKDSVISAKEAEIGQWKALKAEQDALIVRQNLAVEGWKAAGVENARRAILAEKRASDVVQNTKQRIQSIQAAQIPSSCPEAMQWLLDQRSSFSW